MASYENTIESFINFCDDMHIANEGFDIKKTLKTLWDRFVEMLKKLKQRISDAFKALFGKETSKEAELNKKYAKLLEDNAKALDKINSLTISYDKDTKELKQTISAKVAVINQVKSSLNKLTSNKEDDDKAHLNQTADLSAMIEKLNAEKQAIMNELENTNEVNSELKKKINNLNKYIDDIRDDEANKIAYEYKKAKERIASGKNPTITDYWGYVEMVFKAFPEAEKLVKDNVTLINWCKQTYTGEKPSTEKLEELKDYIDKLEPKIDDCYSTCKTIFKHSEQESAMKNPKTYSRDTIEKFFKGIKQQAELLDCAEDSLRKAYEKNITNNRYAAGEVGVSGTNNDAILNRVFTLSIRLVSVLNSYVNLIYKVKSLCNEVRPASAISYKNYKGNYNYGGYNDDYYKDRKYRDLNDKD